MSDSLITRTLIILIKFTYLKIIDLRINLYHLLLKMAKHEHRGFNAMMTKYEEMFED